jgi:hypothetical protein
LKICFYSSGFLLCRGLYHKNVSVTNLWSTEFGSPIIRKMMSRDGFKKICKHLRFDDKNKREESDDKFIMIRELWNCLIENSQTAYIPEKIMKVDEQLLPCKNRCPFIQFLPKKPDKFGNLN